MHFTMHKSGRFVLLSVTSMGRAGAGGTGPLSLHGCPRTAQHHTPDTSTCTAQGGFPLLDLRAILPQLRQTINLQTQKDRSWMSLKAWAAYCTQVKPGRKSTEAKLQGILPANTYICITSIKKKKKCVWQLKPRFQLNRSLSLFIRLTKCSSYYLHL